MWTRAGYRLSSLVLLLVACSAQDQGTGTPPASRPSGGAATPADVGLHDAFDRILAATVRDERVDYLAIRKDHWRELTGYRQLLARTDPASLSRDARLAYWINLYNATMIAAVVERFAVGYSPQADSFGVFKEPLGKAGGKVVSLDEIENRIVRPEFEEPRIHAALVCAARSCPPLLARAYRAEDLEATLEANMRRFVNDPFRNKIDVEARKLQLSSIFKWYATDFGGEDRLAAYVDRYTDADVRGFAVSFLDYSWQLNIAPPAAGRWVSVTTDVAGEHQALRRGAVVEVRAEKEGRLQLALPFGDDTVWIDTDKTAPFRT